jgi:hypothetical protein
MPVPTQKSDAEIRCLCITIVLFGIVSFRSVPRILSIFFEFKEWIPHFTSVINWTLKLGLALLKEVIPISEPWIAILDHSIDIGVKKVLVVLRVKISALKKRESAITLGDCECIGVKIHEKSNGEIIAKDLSDIFEKSGIPVGVLKDGGGDLAKGVELWRKSLKEKVEVIDDIGHVVANAIKAQYAKSKLFKLFLKILDQSGKRLRQTKLAFLKPPKLRTKGRFQSISITVNWAVKILELFEDKSSQPEYKKLKFALSGLSQIKIFLVGFATNIVAASEIMKVVKNEGMNLKSFKKIEALINKMTTRSIIKKRLTIWSLKHLEIQQRMQMDDTPLLVSSDIIESLFGKFKHILARGSMVDMNRTVLLIPTLCQNLNSDKIQKLINNISLKSVAEWDQENVPYTQNRKRREFLRGENQNIGPNTGDLYSQTG